MKTTAQRRLARFTGLVLLSLLAVAVGVQVAQAAANSATPAAAWEGRGGITAIATTPSATWEGRGGITALAAAPAATWEGRGGITAFSDTPAAGAGGRGGMATVRGVTAAQPGLSGPPSTTTWIIVGSTIAVLAIGLATWTLITRRRQRDEPLSMAFCAQHPEHAMCGTA
jgi:hypothetical protein